MTDLIELESLNENFFKGKNTVVVIGFFDGVHLGHKKIIELCVERAKEINGISIVFTFDKPPLNIIKGEIHKKLISSFEHKLKLVESLGVDFIVTARFDAKFSKLRPEQFCKEILFEKFHVKEIFVGKSFRFGWGAKGNDIFLKEFFRPYNIKVNVVPLYRVNGVPVSSTVIRKYFLEGNIEKIKAFLGRYPQVSGKVIRASGRGRKLGFPTANIDVCEKFVIPKDGVYLGRVEISDEKGEKPAIINVGSNPTFKETKKWIEIYILNFDRDIYGKEIIAYFLKRLRDEIVFKNKDQLVKQIQHDLEYAKKYFKV